MAWQPVAWSVDLKARKYGLCGRVDPCVGVQVVVQIHVVVQGLLIEALLSLTVLAGLVGLPYLEVFHHLRCLTHGHGRQRSELHHAFDLRLLHAHLELW